MKIVVLAILVCGQISDVNVGPQGCGAHCLSLVAGFYGQDGARVLQELPPEKGPYSFADLERVAAKLGLQTLARRWNDPRHAIFPCPAILHVKGTVRSSRPDHFIICWAGTKDRLLLGDFPDNPRWVGRRALLPFWDGTLFNVDGPGGKQIAKLLTNERRIAQRRGLLIAACGMIGVGLWVLWAQRRRRGVVTHDSKS